jgi:hypothetical protein
MKRNTFLPKHLLLSSMVLIMFAFTCNTFLYAQSSQGTEFWIGFPSNISQAGARELYITAAVTSEVTVNIVSPAFNTTVTVAAGSLTTINLPNAVDISSNGVIENKGIHITSDNPVTVYGMNSQQASTDAYLALPVNALGTNYYVMGYTRDHSFTLWSQMTIVATQDNTHVTIIPTATGGGFAAGVPGQVTLNTGQVFQLRSNAFGSDYTGSSVIADKPVSVFGGNDCTNISGNLRACDHLVQQMIPIEGWGQSFLTVPLATRLAGDVFRIMAQQNGTSVNINGSLVATLDAGQFYETILGSTTYNHITASNPILVGQYSRSSDADGVTSDPFFTLLPSAEQFINNYIVSAGTANIPNNFLNITSPNANTGSVLVNGVVVSPMLWTPITGTNFSGAQVPVTNGIHNVSSILPVGLMVYGFGSFDSYGYLGGQAFGAVATVASISITPKAGTAMISTQQCWQALVLDQNGVPVTGVRVDFNITGPNSQLSGFAFTGADGIAHFCIQGVNPGTDTIAAVIGSLSDTASFTWTGEVAIPLSDWAIYLGIFLILVFSLFRFKRVI